MMKRLLIGLALLTGITFFAPQPADALSIPQSARQFAACEKNPAEYLGFSPWDACLVKDGNGNPKLTKLGDVWLIALTLLEDVIKAAGYMAVGFIIWGGVKYLKSQGEPAELTTARVIINNAIIGLVISMLSIALVQFVAGAFKAS